MTGQQNIFDYDKETLFNKHNESLINQVDMWYIEDKFAIKTDFKEEKALHNYLLKEMYSTQDCELLKFLSKKLRGALGDENIKIVNLPEMETQYGDTNNYYYTSANYETVEF